MNLFEHLRKRVKLRAGRKKREIKTCISLLITNVFQEFLRVHLSMWCVSLGMWACPWVCWHALKHVDVSLCVGVPVSMWACLTCSGCGHIRELVSVGMWGCCWAHGHVCEHVFEHVPVFFSIWVWPWACGRILWFVGVSLSMWACPYLFSQEYFSCRVVVGKVNWGGEAAELGLDAFVVHQLVCKLTRVNDSRSQLHGCIKEEEHTLRVGAGIGGWSGMVWYMGSGAGGGESGGEGGGGWKANRSCRERCFSLMLLEMTRWAAGEGGGEGGSGGGANCLCKAEVGESWTPAVTCGTNP